MTEQEWLKCTDLLKMLEFLRDNGSASDRKLRLFACGRCRVLWAEMVDERSKQAVEVAEAFADRRGVSKKYRSMLRDQRNEAERLAIEAFYVAIKRVSREHPHAIASLSAVFAAGTNCISVEPYLRPGFHFIEPIKVASILRELFGNPFRPITLDPAWLTWHDGLLVSMAQKMYDNRDFSDMPVLADALEEAGCMNPDILEHCRSGGEHVRGCWVIDALLGRS
jgi:bacterioferritin-associated ferredoxin